MNCTGSSNLNNHSRDVNHEALLSLVRTSSLMQKTVRPVFSQFGLTDVQFNILMILKEHGSAGLSSRS